MMVTASPVSPSLSPVIVSPRPGSYIVFESRREAVNAGYTNIQQCVRLTDGGITVRIADVFAIVDGQCVSEAGIAPVYEEGQLSNGRYVFLDDAIEFWEITGPDSSRPFVQMCRSESHADIMMESMDAQSSIIPWTKRCVRPRI